MRHRVIIASTSDLTTDQRIARIADTYSKHFDEVLLVSRNFNSPRPLLRNFETKRFNLVINKGPIFYASYNLRLFLFLLLKKHDAVVANDVDTLLACYLATKIKRATLFFDAHEYFSEVPELTHRKGVKKIWQAIESFIIPKLKHCYTVSEGIANAYFNRYGTEFKVVRNVPFRIADTKSNAVTKQSIGLNSDDRIIIYQGAVNIGRGLEEAVSMMQYLPDNVKLIIVGDGDIFDDLRKQVEVEKLSRKVIFTGRMNPDVLRNYTALADIGISIEKEMGLSYTFALPNKLFDYVQSNIPVVVSGLPYMKQLVEFYKIGVVLPSHDCKQMAEIIAQLLNDFDALANYRTNLLIAAEQLCWENEEKIVEGIIEKSL